MNGAGGRAESFESAQYRSYNVGKAAAIASVDFRLSVLERDVCARAVAREVEEELLSATNEREMDPNRPAELKPKSLTL